MPKTTRRRKLELVVSRPGLIGLAAAFCLTATPRAQAQGLPLPAFKFSDGLPLSQVLGSSPRTPVPATVRAWSPPAPQSTPLLSRVAASLDRPLTFVIRRVAPPGLTVKLTVVHLLPPVLRGLGPPRRAGPRTFGAKVSQRPAGAPPTTGSGVPRLPGSAVLTVPPGSPAGRLAAIRQHPGRNRPDATLLAAALPRPAPLLFPWTDGLTPDRLGLPPPVPPPKRCNPLLGSKTA